MISAAAAAGAAFAGCFVLQAQLPALLVEHPSCVPQGIDLKARDRKDYTLVFMTADRESRVVYAVRTRAQPRARVRLPAVHIPIDSVKVRRQ